MGVQLEIIIETKSGQSAARWEQAAKVARQSVEGFGCMPQSGDAFVKQSEGGSEYVDATGTRFLALPGHEFHRVVARLDHPAAGVGREGLTMASRLIDAIESAIDCPRVLVGADEIATLRTAKAHQARVWSREAYAELCAVADGAKLGQKLADRTANSNPTSAKPKAFR